MTKETILIISHVNPALRSAGNEIRIYKMIKWLRKEGVKVVLLLNHPPLSPETRDQLRELVNEVHTTDEFAVSASPRIIRAMKRRLFGSPAPLTESEQTRSYLCPPELIKGSNILCKRYRPKAMIAEYIFTAPCLRNVQSGVLKLIDTHDMLSNRDPKEAIYCSPEEERAYLLDADVVIAIQTTEAEKFRALVPERKVVTVGIDYEIADHGKVDEACKNTVLIVGANYPGNVYGLKEFCEHAWPLVCTKNPRAELLVAGKIGQAISSNVPQTRVLGWVDDLQALYRKASVVINPTSSGTGLKIKTVEALCNGRPLVATPNGVEGLDFGGEAPCIVCDNWPDFAEAIVSLLENDDLCIRFQESAFRFAEEEFTGSKVYNQLAAILWGQVP